MSSSAQLGTQPAERKRALFIDADPEVREMLWSLLDPMVWSVRHAPDNKTALALAAETHYDLILTSEKNSRQRRRREARGMRPGGYGVLLAKKLVDDLLYSEKGNEGLLVKYIGVPPLKH